MDWQKIAALGVVAVTAGLFLRAKLRRPKFSFEHDTHCGCAAPAPGAGASMLFRARKGGRATITVKNKNNPPARNTLLPLA
jgi:hypothetical protein